jgi:hypothetical protein
MNKTAVIPSCADNEGPLTGSLARFREVPIAHVFDAARHKQTGIADARSLVVCATRDDIAQWCVHMIRRSQ